MIPAHVIISWDKFDRKSFITQRDIVSREIDVNGLSLQFQDFPYLYILTLTVSSFILRQTTRACMFVIRSDIIRRSARIACMVLRDCFQREGPTYEASSAAGGGLGNADAEGGTASASRGDLTSLFHLTLTQFSWLDLARYTTTVGLILVIMSISRSVSVTFVVLLCLCLSVCLCVCH